MGTFPSLNVHTGKESAAIPELDSECLPDAHHVVHESGSVTLEVFEEYLLKVILPFLQRQFPGLRKDVEEFLFNLVYDIPSVHNVSDTGVIITGLPPNSTHRSQPCDNRAVLGAFKKGYYHLFKTFLVARQGRQETQKALDPSDILPLKTRTSRHKT